MPTLDWNKRAWETHYQWPQGGDEWSVGWGGPDVQWYGSILLRIHAFLPVDTILEIAPGFGRWTQFLLRECKHLFVVDLSAKCIDACKRRFAEHPHISYFVNDGMSLAMIPDESVDFIFSYDSLVHAEADVIASYLVEARRILKRDGVGFIHHSNLGELARYLSVVDSLPRVVRAIGTRLGVVDRDLYWDHNHARERSMAADRFRMLCDQADLQCTSQEVLPWNSKKLIDCYSVFTRKGSVWACPYRSLRNSRSEGPYLAHLANYYGRSSVAAHEPQRAAAGSRS